MKLKEAIQLDEGFSPVLYHGTDFNSFMNILKNNQFRLSPAFTKEIEAKYSNKLYYMSAARNRSAPYHRDPIQPSVLLILDGRKLSSRFSGLPMDYWGPEMRKINPTGFEQEDRIVSDKPAIDNAMSYVRQVDIYHDPMKFANKNKAVFSAYVALRRANIPVRIYEDRNDWVLGNRHYMSSDEVQDMLSVAGEVQTPSGLSPEFLYKSAQRAKQGPLTTYLAAMKTDNPNSIPDLNLLKNFIMYYRPEVKQYNSTLNQFKNEFSNAYRNPELRNVIEEFGREMRKLGLKDIGDIADHIFYKWRRILYGDKG